MQTSAGGDLAGPATPDLKQRPAGGIARGAAVIAALTIVARLFGLAVCAAGTAVGVAVSLAVPLHHTLVAAALAVLVAGCAIIASGVVAYILDDGDLKAVLAWVRRAVRLRS